MTIREIRKYINRLNSGKSKDLIFVRPISKYVDFAKVWDKQPNIKDNVDTSIDSYNFFFLRNEQNKYVGAVQDGGNDLHWYVVPQSRKQGYLTRALKESILPYIFTRVRDSQRITIEKNSIGENNYINSKKVAYNLGFKAKNEEETEFYLTKPEFNWGYNNINEKNTNISSERFDELRKRAFYASKILLKISDELLMSLDDDKELKKLASEVGYYKDKIDDLEWGMK